MRIKDIKISDEEILENVIYIDNKEFRRYYHHGKKPTRYFISNDGLVFTEISNLIMSPSTNKGGYFTIGMRFKNKGKPKYTQIHIMVATEWCGGYHKDLCVDHLDGNKKNNHYTNFEWVTFSENTYRAYNRTGAHKKYFGDKNKNCSYPDKLIHQVCEYLVNGKSVKETSEITGVSITTIHHLLSGQARNNITKLYKFPDNLRKPKHEAIPDEIKNKIKQMYGNKIPIKEISTKIGISYNRVVHVIYDDRYKG